MKDQIVPILLNLVAGLFGALGQYLYKIGSQKLGQVPLYKNGYLFFGMLMFCLVMILFVSSFKLGGKLSVVYPVYATTFIWGLAIAVFWVKESYSWIQIVGTLTICFGVTLIALGAPK
ncbi:MAG: hypothetical protein AABZ60_03535 [Planctomycetota bacterium]